MADPAEVRLNSDTHSFFEGRPLRLTSLHRIAILGALLATAWPAAGRAQDTAAGGARSVGVWDLKLDDGSRQCRLMLRSQSAGAGFALGLPPGCHRAFPTLSTVATWKEAGDGQIQLADKAGQPLVILSPAGEGALAGTGPDGATYRLDPVGPHKALALKPTIKPATPAAAPGAEAAVPVPSRQAPPVAEVAGHYAVMRDKTRDTGCMVTLDPKARGAKGLLKANLAPACRDQGIVVFDPVAWEMIGGRLVLMARKGHTTKFDLQDDGTWLKDPEDGKSMGLKRL